MFGNPLTVFNTFVTRRDTTTIGEFLTVAALATPSEDFTGPVYVVNGEADYPFCGGNCTFRIDVTASVTPTLFPAVVVSDHYNVPRIGHNIFAHDSNLVFDVFDKILGFLKTNSLDANTGEFDYRFSLLLTQFVSNIYTYTMLERLNATTSTDRRNL